MDVTARVAELNAATASLAATMGATPAVWSYVGDMNIAEGGTAIKVDQPGRYFASVVELTDLASAIGQSGCVLIQTGSIALDRWSLGKRRTLKSALATFGWKASDLLQFTRDERAVEIARALWVYGWRDTDPETVVRYDGATADEIEYVPGGGYMEPDSEVDGESELVDKFMEYLD